jgi:hypothetical protein
MGASNMPGSGGIPLVLLDLTGLIFFGLSSNNNFYNKLVGSIPDSISKLTGLTTLYLDCNALVGSIPTAIGELTELASLSLYSNQLTGSIPSNFAKLTRLVHVWLSNNQLMGTVPQGLTGLRNLTSIMLDNNPHLTGLLPAFNFSQFTCCSMGGDSFKCPLPDGVEKCVGNDPSTAVCMGTRPRPTCAPVWL